MTWCVFLFERSRLPDLFLKQVRKSLTSLKAKFGSAFRTKQSAKVACPHKEQVGIFPSPNELVQAGPSSPGANTSVHPPVPPDNPTCINLPGLSDLHKFEGDPTHRASDHRKVAPQRQGSGSYNSTKSNVAVSGMSENDYDKYSFEADLNKTQGSPIDARPQEPPVPLAGAQGTTIQPTLAQNPPIPTVPIHMTPVRNVLAQVQPPGPNGTLPRPPGLSPFFPHMLPDVQNARRNLPVKPANLPPSPSTFMVIPTLGVSPMETASVMAHAPNMSPTPFRDQGKIPGAICLAPKVIPSLLRSPRPGARCSMDPVSPGVGKQEYCGVIGDRRAAKNQLQSRVAEGPRNEPKTKEKTLSVEIHTSVNDEADSSQDRFGDPYPEPIFAGGKYYVGKFLGGGETRKVYSAIDKNSMAIRALKVIKRKDLKLEDLTMVKEELIIMRTISQIKFFGPQRSEALQFVNHLLESWYDKDCIYFAMVRSADSNENLAIDV